MSAHCRGGGSKNPRQLMAFLGLVPGEHSSGGKRKLTGITKAGSIVARRLIVEAAWAYRMPAKIGQAMMLRRNRGLVAADFMPPLVERFDASPMA